MREPMILVRIDLYGEDDPSDMWEGYIVGKTAEEFLDIRAGFEHDGRNDIRVTWADYLVSHDVTFHPLHFDIEEFM